MSHSVMTKILTPQTKNLEPSNQVTNKDEKTFEKEEYQLIYDTFVKVLEDKAKLKENEGITDAFISTYKNILLSNVNPEDIRPLSEENFCQFLLSVFKEIREQGLAREEKLNNDKIQQIITKCVTDIRGTEAKDSFIKLAGWPLGVKVDPKNFFSSFKDGLLEKVPFFGKDKKEEDEPPLSDEEMVTTFLSKIFFPVLLSIASISIFGPTTLAVVAAAVGAIFAVKGGVEVLFSNNKPGTLYDPSSRDRDDTEKRAKLNGKILEGIDDILKTPVTGVEKGTSVSEQISQKKEKSEQQPVPEQISQENNRGNEKSEQQDRSWAGKENKRREETIEQQPSKT